MIVIEYILGSLYRVAFILILIIFHPVQIIALNILGDRAHQRVVQFMNGCIVTSFRIAGTKITFTNNYKIASERPLIIIANHQSLWDIVGLYWFMRKHFPLFVSKVELSKGIPSISYNLRKSGSALIDRSNRKQAIFEIINLSSKIKLENRAAVIFPEGTRSKDGQLKSFAIGGIAGLMKKCDNALIVPIVINGNWDLVANKYYRIRMGKSISWTVLEPFEARGLNPAEVLAKSYKIIKEGLI